MAEDILVFPSSKDSFAIRSVKRTSAEVLLQQ